jgi:hypothetical protein
MICLLASFVLITKAKATSVSGFEAWQQAEISQRLEYNLSAMIEAENRILSSSPYWVYNEVDPQILWRYSPRYDFTGGMEFSSWRYPGSQMMGYQPFVDTRIKWNGGRWSFSSRQRFQTGSEGRVYVAMFRQLSRLQYQLSGFSNRLSLYAADEWFLDLVTGQLPENRAFFGSSYALNAAVNLEFYGVLQTFANYNGLSGNLPGIGIKAVCAF